MATHTHVDRTIIPPAICIHQTCDPRLVFYNDVSVLLVSDAVGIMPFCTQSYRGPRNNANARSIQFSTAYNFLPKDVYEAII